MELERIEALLKLMREYGLAELELESEESRLALRMPVAAVIAAPVQGPLASAPGPRSSPSEAPRAAEAAGVLVKSPMVGTFYRAARPDAPPFVDVGDRVRKGQAICILEAMKLMNELECDVTGTVAEILVENGQPVQFGQPLFRILPG